MAGAKKVKVSFALFIDMEMDPANYDNDATPSEMMEVEIQNFMEPESLVEYLANGGSYQVTGRLL
jgi:hypothetical protein